jgi:hypothetical protein
MVWPELYFVTKVIVITATVLVIGWGSAKSLVTNILRRDTDISVPSYVYAAIAFLITLSTRFGTLFVWAEC